MKRTRRKTVSIIVDRDSSVLVRVPTHVGDEEVARLVESKKLWIEQALAEQRELNASRIDREYKNGESFPYLPGPDGTTAQ